MMGKVIHEVSHGVARYKVESIWSMDTPQYELQFSTSDKRAALSYAESLVHEFGHDRARIIDTEGAMMTDRMFNTLLVIGVIVGLAIWIVSLIALMHYLFDISDVGKEFTGFLIGLTGGIIANVVLARWWR